ncbi:hypothetical protein J6590_026289 [Homalodisca vitripennis]|nr:hypothetical protein J6590_026289 [Homalodisca vitripennis]
MTLLLRLLLNTGTRLGAEIITEIILRAEALANLEPRQPCRQAFQDLEIMTVVSLYIQESILYVDKLTPPKTETSIPTTLVMAQDITCQEKTILCRLQISKPSTCIHEGLHWRSAKTGIEDMASKKTILQHKRILQKQRRTPTI